MVNELERLWRNGPRSRVEISIGDNKPELRSVHTEYRFIKDEEEEEVVSNGGPLLPFDIFDSLTVSSSKNMLEDNVSTDSCDRDVEESSGLI